MQIIFFYIRGIVHKKFVPTSRTVTAKLRESVRRKLPEMWRNKHWFLHQYNTPAHTSLVVKQFLAKSNMITSQNPPSHSKQLASCDFQKKLQLKGRCSDFVGAKSQDLLKIRTSVDFQHCFQGRWNLCINVKGNYIENYNKSLD